MLRVFLFSLTLVLIIACSSEQPEMHSNDLESDQTSCQKIEHSHGITDICGQPQRIVTLNPKMLDLLLSLEVQPVGYAEVFTNRQGDFDQPSQQIPYLGVKITQPIKNLGLSGEPSLEALAQLQPDLILGDIRGNKKNYDQLSQIAPTLLFDYVGADKWQDPLRALGQALNRSEQAEAVISRHQQELSQLREVLSPVIAKFPTVLMVGTEQMGQTINLVTPLDFCGGLVDDLGFKLVALTTDPPETINSEVSIEVLPRLDADLVIVQAHNMKALTQIDTVATFESDQLHLAREAWRDNPLAQSLKATQANRVYFIPTYLCLGIPSPTGSHLIFEELQQQLEPLASTGSDQL